MFQSIFRRQWLRRTDRKSRNWGLRIYRHFFLWVSLKSMDRIFR